MSDQPSLPVADTPDDALIEATIEAIFEAILAEAVDNPMWIDDKGQPLYYSSKREVLIGEFVADAARAAYAALVEHLELTEEGCCDATYREQEETGKHNVYTCADMGMTCERRLVSKWVEVTQP